MDPQNSNALYVGTDVGVFFSPDDGVEWMPYGTGLPNTGIDFMEVHIKNRVIRAGTHGRSIWQIPLEDDVKGIVFPAQRTVWTLGDTASIQWHGFASPVNLELSLDGGSSWQPIASVESDSLYLISNVSYPSSSNALVRVSDGTDSLISPLFSIAQQKAGNQTGTVADVRFYAYDIAYDKDDNVLWATSLDPTEDNIFKLDPDIGTILDSVKIPTTAHNRDGFTGIKYDPASKNLFLQEVTGAVLGSYSSTIYEVTTSGTIVQQWASPANALGNASGYGTGIFVKGDTLLAVDRGTEQIFRATLPNLDFSIMNPLDFSANRTSAFGSRALTYDTALKQYLIAYTDFQGSLTSPTLNASYLLFLDPESGEELNAFTIAVGEEVTNVRGLEYDPRGAGNTAWMTVLTGGSSSQIIKIALSDGPAGAPAGSLTILPSTIAFGSVDTGKSKTVQAEIHNTGTAATTITALGIEPAGSPFTLGSISLPITLQAGDSVSVSVTFAPHLPNAQSASLAVTYGQDNQQASFPITGFATENGLGVADEVSQNKWGIELYPNPARDFVEVTIDANAADNLQILLFDVTGRELRNIPLGLIAAGEHGTQLSTDGLPNGMYFVRVVGSNGQVAATRLSIER